MEENRNVWIWVALAVVMLLFFGGFGMGGYGMMGGMGFGFLFMILFWGVLIWLVIALVTAARSSKKGDDALTMLKRRYASGELSKKQYEEMKKGLR